MNHRISFVLLVGFLVCGLVPASAHAAATTQPAPPSEQQYPELNATTPDSFVTHNAIDSAVTLRAPQDWQATKPKTANGKINLIGDPQGTSVNLVVVPMVPGQNIPLTLEMVPRAMAPRTRGFKLLKADGVKLGGQPAGRIVYEATPAPDMKMRFCQFFVVKNGKQYILTYSGLVDRYEPLLPTAEQIAVSLKVPDEGK